MEMKTISYQKRQCRENYAAPDSKAQELSKSIHKNESSIYLEIQPRITLKNFPQVKFKTPSQYQRRIDWLN